MSTPRVLTEPNGDAWRWNEAAGYFEVFEAEQPELGFSEADLEYAIREYPTCRPIIAALLLQPDEP